MAKRKAKKNGKHRTQQSVNQAVKAICDIMRRGKCKTALLYVPELTWILFLRILSEREAREADEAEAVGVTFRPSLIKPYRWQDWASPPETLPAGETNLRAELTGEVRHGSADDSEAGMAGKFLQFVNEKLLPHLRTLGQGPNAAPRQKVIAQIMAGTEKSRINSERDLLDVLDLVHQLSAESVDTTHVFTLSQVYEGLLQRLGEKKNDGGQFFTPREVIRTMLRVIDPKPGESVYDPCCGTAGFLAQSFEYVRGEHGDGLTADDIQVLKERAFYGREDSDLTYPIALANLIVHGFDTANIWHGNTLTRNETYGGLFEGAPELFDVILTNPPFGGKEGKDASRRFVYKTGSTQVLFLQEVMDSLKSGGRCGMVIDEGVLFSTDKDAIVGTKRKLLNDFNLWCVVSLPAGVFTAAGAGVKTDLLFFTKGEQTHKIWYYDLTDVKVRKKNPLTLAHFADFLKALPERLEGELSWTVDIDERKRATAAEARPHHEQAVALRREAAVWNERLQELKRAKPRDDASIAEAAEKVKALERESREQEAKAKEIENRVYDLKAVNQRRRPVEDKRTAAEIIGLVESKGREVAEALAALKAI